MGFEHGLGVFTAALLTAIQMNQNPRDLETVDSDI